jgi:ATP-dependent RNA helicase DDX18/HAS1
LKKFQRKKIIVAVSSTAAAKGYADILSAFGISVFEVHGKQTTRKRATNYSEFKKAKEGTLLCTDAVLRGPEVIRRALLDKTVHKNLGTTPY